MIIENLLKQLTEYLLVFSNNTIFKFIKWFRMTKNKNLSSEKEFSFLVKNLSQWPELGHQFPAVSDVLIPATTNKF